MKKRLLTCLLAVVAVIAIVCLVACKTEEEPPATYNVTIEDCLNGKVTADAVTVTDGGKVTLSVAADDGYHLDWLKVNGQTVTVIGSTYVVENVKSDVNVTAAFALNDVTVTYSVTVEPCTNGKVVASATSVTEGGSVTLTVTADSNYELKELKVNGQPVTVTEGVYVMENITSNITVSATFEQVVSGCVVTFDYGAGSGSEASRVIDEGVAIGDLPEVTAPNNSLFRGWYVGETRIDATYTVSTSVTVKASFVSVELSVKDNVKLAISGLDSENVYPEIVVVAKIDGTESDVAVTLSTDSDEVATIAENKLTAVADGKVAIIAKIDDAEIARISIECRNYADYSAIATKSDFFAIANNRAGKYYLTADIDVGGGIWTSDWAPLLGTFTGVLDGRGHSISNGTHADGWDKGIAEEVKGTIRDIAFVNMTIGGTRGSSANNAFFGKVTGLVENVYLDYLMPYTQPYNSETGAAALASYLDEGGLLKNIVVNLRTNQESFASATSAIAVFANSWKGYAENVLVMTNGNKLTSEFYGGLYCKEAASGVAEYVTTNCNAYLYTYNLINGDEITKLDSSVWSVRDNAVYFHDTVALAATPEYVILYKGGDISKNYETELPDAEIVVVNFLHNTELMDELPEITFASTNEEVATIGLDDDDNVFISYKGKGKATLSITVGNAVCEIHITLNQVAHIASVEDFRTKVPQALNGVIVLDNDIDFNGETVKGVDENGETIWAGYDEFTGSFDGQGHTISNLKLGDGWSGGLFGKLTNGGVIKNVAFVNLVTAGQSGAHGLLGTLDGGARLENCYVDILFHANGLNLDANWAGTGPFCVLHAGNAEIKNCIANIRFADGFDLEAIDHIGAISGKGAAWSSMCYDVKVIVNANVDIKLAYADGAENDGVQKQWTTCAQYADFAALLASGVDAYKTYWTIGETGISFGENVVLAVPEYTLTNGADVVKVYDDEAESFEVAVGVRHYITAQDALPESATATSSNKEVATVAITEGKVIVTPVGLGEAIITVAVGDAQATVKVTFVEPSACDLVYDGGDVVATFETEKILDNVVITGLQDGETVDVPAAVVCTSTNESVAVLVLQDGVLKVKVVGAGEATLSAVCGNGQAVTLKVTATKVYQIASVGDFRSKIAADLAGNFVLTADLDFAGNTPTGGWSSFGDFSGTIDGQGHKIENMLLGDGWAGGVFTWYSGTIKNVAFVNVTQASSMHGLVGAITGGKFENVYVDYVISSNGRELDANWCAAGAFATNFDTGSIKDCIVNIRFADNFDLAAIDRVGLVAGRASSYNGTCQNVKIIVDGEVELKLAYADAVEGDDVQKQWDATQYSSLAALVESGVDAYTGYWTISESGITFGNNQVLTVAVAE